MQALKDFSNAAWDWVSAHPRLVTAAVVIGGIGILLLYALRGMWA